MDFKRALGRLTRFADRVEEGHVEVPAGRYHGDAWSGEGYVGHFARGRVALFDARPGRNPSGWGRGYGPPTTVCSCASVQAGEDDDPFWCRHHSVRDALNAMLKGHRTEQLNHVSVSVHVELDTPAARLVTLVWATLPNPDAEWESQATARETYRGSDPDTVAIARGFVAGGGAAGLLDFLAERHGPRWQRAADAAHADPVPPSRLKRYAFAPGTSEMRVVFADGTPAPA